MHDQSVAGQSVAGTLFISPSNLDESSTLEWSGFLESDLDGAYRIGAKFVGSLRIELNGKVLIESESAEPKSVVSEPIQLEYDLHQLKAQLKAKDVRVALTTF